MPLPARVSVRLTRRSNSNTRSQAKCSMRVSRAGLTQGAVAEKMDTTKNAISRLESAGKHASSLATLKHHARAVGCELQVKLILQKGG